MLKQPIVDDDIAADRGNAMLCDLVGERLVSGERIGRWQDRVPSSVRFIKVKIGYCDRSVRVGASAHRQITRRDEREIAVQDAVAVEIIETKNRGGVMMVGADPVDHSPMEKTLRTEPMYNWQSC